MKLEKNNQISLENGMMVDLDAAWKKLSNFQFGGTPGRGMCELIQNAIDSYDKSVEWQDRKAEIETGSQSIQITDYGQGMPLSHIELLLTLGGTTKGNDPDKIGQFGIGFFSMFNKGLGTKLVQVTTLCDGESVEITFKVPNPNSLPEIKTRVLASAIPFSTRVFIAFDRQASVNQCIRHAKAALKYYPVDITIDGVQYPSIWAQTASSIVKDGQIMGFVEPLHYPYSTEPAITLLCKFELLNQYVPAGRFSRGGRDTTYDLRDYKSQEVPIASNFHVCVNNNTLNLTISRDSYYLDSNWKESVKFAACQLAQKLLDQFDRLDTKAILANLYILSGRVRTYLQTCAKPSTYSDPRDELAARLAQARIFKFKNKQEQYSMLDIKNLLSKDLPLYYSQDHYNIDWLGGDFKHDFIVLTEACLVGEGAPEFYKTLFNSISYDQINLDTISQNSNKIKALVKRGIVTEKALHPKTKFIGQSELTDAEAKLILELNQILSFPQVREVIADNLQLPIGKIHAFFFEMEERGALICTGLWNNTQESIAENHITNLTDNDSEDIEWPEKGLHDYILGLRIDHPLIKRLVNTSNRFRSLYTLSYLASELVNCQRRLVPYSTFTAKREKLTADMRVALIEIMFQNKNAAA